MPKKSKTFEVAMIELEEVTSLLESGQLTLDQSIKHYKKGMELAAYCNNILQKAEQEIYILDEDIFKRIDEESTNE